MSENFKVIFIPLPLKEEKTETDEEPSSKSETNG
jgi:hypothetical protein